MTVRRPICSGSWLLTTGLLAIVSSPTHAFHVTKLEGRRSFLSNQKPGFLFQPNKKATIPRKERIFRWRLPQTGDDNNYDSNQDSENNNDAPPNPYADPNYPDLEFIDYSNPNYMVDQGESDEYYPKADDTEEMIEAMREERRRRNDEYQFETYYAKVLQEGQEYRGEWTIYQTDTFLPSTTTSTTSSSSFAKEEEIAPRLVPAPRTLQVISKGYKIQVEDPSEVKFRVDAERICHVERIVAVTSDDDIEDTSQEQYDQILRNQYWPLQLCARDFRGDMGIMCVGNAYTICTSRPFAASTTTATTTLERDTAEYVGPFAEHWTELGLLADRLRLRIKLHYSVLPDYEKNNLNNNGASPPLYLKSLTVCREMLDMWPSDAAATYPVAWEALFGSTGAPGGLFDPPPVGSADQARHYRLIELPGRATILIPVQLDQDEAGAAQVAGWVTTLDWTSPLAMRYQVDRKVKSGNYISGLRTLELSEIQSENVEQYRPRDGGQDMRQ